MVPRIAAALVLLSATGLCMADSSPRCDPTDPGSKGLLDQLSNGIESALEWIMGDDSESPGKGNVGINAADPCQPIPPPIVVGD